MKKFNLSGILHDCRELQVIITSKPPHPARDLICVENPDTSLPYFYTWGCVKSILPQMAAKQKPRSFYTTPF